MPEVIPDAHKPASASAEPQQFASDNYAGICPEAWAAMAQANRGHVSAYGDDRWTQAGSDALRALFETPCEVFFAFNGTAANSLALAALCQSYHSVICSASAHVETDECGAPEFFSNGSKLLVATTPSGKLTPDAILALAESRSDIHFRNPVSSRLPSRPRPGKSTRSPRSRRSRRPAASSACGCIWTERALPMPAPASAALRQR